MLHKNSKYAIVYCAGAVSECGRRPPGDPRPLGASSRSCASKGTGRQGTTLLVEQGVPVANILFAGCWASEKALSSYLQEAEAASTLLQVQTHVNTYRSNSCRRCWVMRNT